MKQTLYNLAGFIVILSFSISPSYAWWEAGHMLIANIAYKHLNKNAKAEVDHLLHFFDIENTKEHDYSYNEQKPNYTLMAIALWPDQIQAFPNYQKIGKSWHYIEVPFSTDNTTTPEKIPRDNIVWVIRELVKQLSLKQGNNYDRARALSYLVHFVADIHQPLHCGELFRRDLPHGDFGGNAYKISYQEPNGTLLTNLHSLWDSGLRLFPAKGFPYDVSKPQDIEELSKLIMNENPMSVFNHKYTSISPEQWKNESHQLAITAHEIEFGATPSDSYLDENSLIAEKQIALAGYRLAHTLNKILG
jgi:S1/P1 Nuclease